MKVKCFKIDCAYNMKIPDENYGYCDEGIDLLEIGEDKICMTFEEKKESGNKEVKDVL